MGGARVDRRRRPRRAEAPRPGRPGAARLLGLRRGGPPPPATRAGQPLRPLTLPNAVGYVRLALIPAFLVLALSSGDGRAAWATVSFSVAAGADYLDGLLARATGQYSRLGALMDPLIDRLVVVAGVVVTWRFELLPRWALAVLVGREAGMVLLAAAGLRLAVDVRIVWIGRIAVWPTMLAIWLALVAETRVAEAFLYVGIAGALAASAVYVRDGLRSLRGSRPRP